MSRPRSEFVSELLVRWKDRDQEALGALAPLVYNELRRLGALREKKFKTLGISFLGLWLSFEPG